MKPIQNHSVHRQGFSKKGLFLVSVALVILAGISVPAFTDRSGFFGLGHAKILFVGDMMFDRTMRKVGEAKGYEHLFSCVNDYLRDFDFVVGNLEGPITSRESLSLSTRPGDQYNTTFTFSPAIAKVLAKNKFRAVSLGNNHIWDFGREGAESTMATLEKEGVLYFGAPNGNLTATTSVAGTKIAFISFNQFLGQNHPEKTVAAIWDARKKNDVIAVVSHWGEEYMEATDYQKALAHRFIDAGADLVIGSHPHVIQEHEIYKGKHIFYSLGNFIFDQYWAENVRTGGGVEVSLAGKDISVKESRFELLRDGRVCLN